jgi:CheY-like chemotaxis protein
MDEPEKIILVVEDDDDVRALAVEVLEAEGYRTIDAANGDRAYRILVEQPWLAIDLLVTDVMMPGRLDGYELAERAHQLRPELKILYATSYAGPPAYRGVRLWGRTLYKPYRPADLRRHVRSVLDEEPVVRGSG